MDLPVKDQALKCCKVLDIAGIIWESVEVNANMSELLEKINSPEDLKKLSLSELKELAAELRELVVDVVSAHEGHLAPNLGAVELTLALHYVFDSPRDKLIWDVGHQAYIHKIITGRRDRFHTIRKLGGLSGFLSREESPHDIFGAGHASTSLAAALGIATARDLKGEDFNVIAIIGDGALTGGMALEAFNQIGYFGRRMIIILNDNKMSIAENVGALSKYLLRLKTSPVYNRLRDDLWELMGKLPGDYLPKRARLALHKIKSSLENLVVPTLLFEEMGYRYIGPVDGHNLELLIDTLKSTRDMKGPVLIHAITVKGKGYAPAEKNPEYFHGLGGFDKTSGKPLKKSDIPKYSEVFGKTLVELAERDEKIIGITAAMPLGTGLHHMRSRFPERFFDMGIAEQSAVTFAAGLTIEGYKPFVAIYSTFLQRAFDQIIHDVALQKLPVRFAIDRAGLVGEDGPTHHGAFDLSYLSLIPNMVVMAPKDEDELRDMILTALLYDKGPIAFRYPRGRGVGVNLKEEPQPIEIGKWELLKEGKDLAVLAVGTMVHPSLKAAERVERETGAKIAVINARFVKPLDEDMLTELCESGISRFITIEENALEGGFGTRVLAFLNTHNLLKETKVLNLGLPDRFVTHGKREELLDIVGLSEEKLAEKIKGFLSSPKVTIHAL